MNPDNLSCTVARGFCTHNAEIEKTLGKSELRLLCAPFSLAGAVPPAWLDTHEHDRCQAYRFAADRKRHLLAHGLKRWAIGYLLDVAPRKLRFTVGEWGKPALLDEALHFNLSHSAGWVVLALYRQAAVGVDVEAGHGATMDPASWPDITHPGESAPDNGRSFLTAWTLKEAISKCSGEGLMMDFRRLCLRSQGGLRHRYHATDGERHWHAGHEHLDSNTHLAYASVMPWEIVTRQLVLSFDRMR
ncbi:4-phosphopantetheinyl transferase [Advenella kashmirensis W13003]|uniref:4-phosphopantetheinyl transferase n=1 Tax=Advenella kashmirensis W13003 TaxID=1424334 RepID=V8QQS8_9BURK|nr:4'-phosphopantetheinyl transferase superfamily protein [Advenella kashmirensis]ETF02326.1 4-phosphopantetheinyl transferase [Advenella kashmirensis W13003]